MRTPESAAKRRRASVVLPAPEGEESTSSSPLRPMRGASPRAGTLARSLNVLDLLAHLVDKRLQSNARPRNLRIGSLGAWRIGFPVELLGQEIEPTPGRLGALEQLPRRRDVGGEPLQLLLHVGAGREQRGLLV